MWKAALVARKPTVSKIDRTLDSSIRKSIDATIYDASDRSSCFYDEICAMKHEAPTIDRMLAIGSVYIVGLCGRVIGVVGVNETTDVPCVYSLCVHPLHRNQGVAKLLLDRVIADNTCLTLTVWKSKTHDRLVQFYSRLGFERNDTLFDEHYTHMCYKSTKPPTTRQSRGSRKKWRWPRVLHAS